jgi:hypothetical protein
MLEQMTDDELLTAVEEARENLEAVQEQFNRLEKEMQRECAFLKPDMNILFTQISNIEGYIRKAENLLVQWDNNRYVSKAVKNREKFMSKPSLIKIKTIKGVM